jgi:hypothetical protein
MHGDFRVMPIVTPRLDQAEYIRAASEIIFSQNYPNPRYIVMDGSPPSAERNSGGYSR